MAARLGVRAGALLLALAPCFVATLLAVFQPLASLMRNHKELRYLATPANMLWSLAAVARRRRRGAAQPRQAIGLDAALGPAVAARTRPLLVVMVVGETARARQLGAERLCAPDHAASWRSCR